MTEQAIIAIKLQERDTFAGGVLFQYYGLHTKGYTNSAEISHQQLDSENKNIL